MPAVTAPANITVAATEATGTTATHAAIVTFLGAATASDAVDGDITTITNNAPAQFPLGTTTVTFSATDTANNAGSAQATVTVIDQSAPVITTAFDGFESANLVGGNGVWVGSWIASGDVSIRTDRNQPHTGSNHVRLRRNSGVLQRQANLSGATDVRLRFWSKIDSFENADIAEVKVSPDGQSFTTVKVFTVSNSDNQYHLYEADLSGFPMTSSFVIMFDAGMSGRGDRWYLDDIEILGRVQ